ncbi:MAG: hypothetical protein FWD61_08460 [Phycisphaerales bacterium]|nr:hypothetical protein [Phycisphaerales bacterium]
MRELINKYAYYIIGVAVVGVLLLIIFRGKGVESGRAATNKAFYVDDETGEESTIATDELPPLLGKNGKPTLVKAIKFTTDGGKTVKIAYLLKYSDQTLAEWKSLTPEYDFRKADLLDHGRLIRLPGEGQKWVQVDSLEAQEILATSIPDSASAKTVWP